MTELDERTVITALTALHGQVVALRLDMDKVARNVVGRDQATNALVLHAARIETSTNNVMLWMKSLSQQTAGQHEVQMRALLESITRPRALEPDSVEVSIPVGAKRITVRGSARLVIAGVLAVSTWLTAYIHGATHGQESVIEAIRK